MIVELWQNRCSRSCMIEVFQRIQDDLSLGFVRCCGEYQNRAIVPDPPPPRKCITQTGSFLKAVE